MARPPGVAKPRKTLKNGVRMTDRSPVGNLDRSIPDQLVVEVLALVVDHDKGGEVLQPSIYSAKQKDEQRFHSSPV